jgi:hypothetical protein
VQLYDLSNAWPQSQNGCIHNLSAFAKAVSLFRIGSSVLNLRVHAEFRRWVWFVHGNFPDPALLPKNHQRRIDPDTYQPGRESGPPVEALDAEECPEE